MAAPSLSPPPTASSPGSSAWSGWFQQVWNLLSRVQVGAGAPTSGAASGTIYLRTDGPPSLYVREGGAWTPK